MRDVELYHHLLGLQPPWSVTRVELALSEQRVDVWVSHAEGVRFPCPACGCQLPLYDHTEPRVWRQLDVSRSRISQPLGAVRPEGDV